MPEGTILVFLGLRGSPRCRTSGVSLLPSCVALGSSVPSNSPGQNGDPGAEEPEGWGASGDPTLRSRVKGNYSSLYNTPGRLCRGPNSWAPADGGPQLEARGKEEDS